MKLLRIGAPGAERPAVLISEGRAAYLGPDRVDHRDDITAQLTRAREVAAGTPETVDLAGIRIGAPVRPGKIICVGLNYADHAAEGGHAAPTEPILFMKAPDTVVGPTDDVLIPRTSVKTDWEVEFGVVIGTEAAYLADVAAARTHVAGYVLCNDVSERHFQLERGGQWDKGKNCATFFPMGPWLVTPDELGDPQQINLGLDVDERAYQASSTAQMIFGVDHLIWYVSQFFTLYPGDVISTGTPAGVGAGQQPPVYLAPGNVMRVWADHLGEQRNRLVQA